MTRRRNQSEAPSRAIPFVIGTLGAAAGLGLGYWIATTKAARDAADDLFKGWRLPAPDFRAHLPETPDDFQRVDDEVCECAESIITEASDGADMAILVDELRLCVARRLHPDFEWPPAAGDHPSVGQLWGELGVMARRALVMETTCDPTVPHPLDLIPVPQP